MKEKITTFLFLGILFTFFILHILSPDHLLSLSERRHLAEFSPPSVKTLVDGSWQESFEDYVLDQFPARDAFRRMKGDAIFHGFHLLDNHELFISGEHVIKMEYPLNMKSVNHFIAKVQEIHEHNLTPENTVYGAWIPDKNFYENGPHLRLDYNALNKTLTSNLPDLQWISLEDVLSLENYYYRDPHWKQETLAPVVYRLAESMGFDPKPLPNTAHVYENFYGAYHGQAAMPFSSEPLTYLSNKTLDHCSVWNMERNTSESIYMPDRLTGMDSYDVFLSGASPLLVIENPDASSSRELILFRDSFGSSLAPLLVENYARITLVDLRYISTELLKQYIEFKDQDVLFLYSTTLINKSFSLK